MDKTVKFEVELLDPNNPASHVLRFNEAMHVFANMVQRSFVTPITTAIPLWQTTDRPPLMYIIDPSVVTNPNYIALSRLSLNPNDVNLGYNWIEPKRGMFFNGIRNPWYFDGTNWVNQT